MATVTIVEEEIASMGRLRPAGQPLNAVSWQAIFAGATASAALSLILLVLGMGLGLSALSPWTGIPGTTSQNPGNVPPTVNNSGNTAGTSTGR